MRLGGGGMYVWVSLYGKCVSLIRTCENVSFYYFCNDSKLEENSASLGYLGINASSFAHLLIFVVNK